MALVFLLGCGQGESTGLAETAAVPAPTSTTVDGDDRTTGASAADGSAPGSTSNTGDEIPDDGQSGNDDVDLAPGELPAVIDDPDGYTNVRAGEGSGFDVVTRVLEGEVFYVMPQGGSQDWWPVRTQAGLTGFMHRSRIVLVEN